jgi:N-acetylglucosaminyl-diphospho-decaprenol L-rhamnosyltransferase
MQRGERSGTQVALSSDGGERDEGILVVIVNYRTGALTADCLRSLAHEAAALPGFFAVVVDNASGDGSVEVMEDVIRSEGFSAWARVIALGTNVGFAAGNNVAMREALRSPIPPKWIMLLNPDTYIREGAVSTLVDFMRRNPGVGIAGGRSEDPDGTPQISCFRFPSVISEMLFGFRLAALGRLLRKWEVVEPYRDQQRQADWVSGAALMMRREVVEAVGLMDEGYFLYFEELDFCLQANRAGFPCWFVPSSRIVHLLGQSTGVTHPSAATRRLPPYWFEGRRRYFLKNWGRTRALLADMLRVVGHLTWCLRRTIQRRADPAPCRFLRDLIRHSVLFRGFRLHPGGVASPIDSGAGHPAGESLAR